MANPHKGEAKIDVAGRSYTLVFDINAMCEVEYILDMDADRILRTLVKSPSLHLIRALLWGGLRRHHADVDLYAAGDLVEQMGGAGPALDGIGRALQASFPDAKEGEDTDRPRKGAAAGTGRRSSKRGSE